MQVRLEAWRRVKAPLRSRWGVFALLGILSGGLLVTGMRIQDGVTPSLEPLLAASRGRRGIPTVWVLFHRMDCVSLRWKIEEWDEAAVGRDVHVEGWALDSPEGWPGRLDPVGELDLSFPVREGPAPRLARGLRALGVRSTPAVLVVDGAGRLREVVPGDRLRSSDDVERVLGRAEVLDA